MPRCSHCGHRFFSLDQEDCPACSRSVRGGAGHAADVPHGQTDADDLFLDPDPSTRGMSPIARFGNAAEAGYFAQELELAERVPARLTIEEDFDAITGRWATRYLLLVPQDRAASAAAALKGLVDQTGGDEVPGLAAERRADGEASGFAGSRRAVAEDGSVNWVPIVLTLAAGSAALWGVRKLNERPKVNLPQAPVGRQHVELWETLATPRAAWDLRNDESDGRWQFAIDRDRNVAVVREDVDGDGVFDKELLLRPVLGRR